MARLVYLNSGLSKSPATLKRIVNRIDPSRYDTKLAEDRFTLREMVAHIADLEPVMVLRMNLALEKPGSEIPNWDQDEEAAKKNYSTWDFHESLAMYAERRVKTVELFESLSQDQVLLSLRHPILGEISVFD